MPMLAEICLVCCWMQTKFWFSNVWWFFLCQAPYQIKMINLKSLTPEEIDWLNAYHSRCRDILAPYLDEAELAWLKKATEPASAWLFLFLGAWGYFPFDSRTPLFSFTRREAILKKGKKNRLMLKLVSLFRLPLSVKSKYENSLDDCILIT